MSKKLEQPGASPAPEVRHREAAMSPGASAKKALKDTREARLAEALRANLKRRKGARKEQE